jgi:hypothetical protein
MDQGISALLGALIGLLGGGIAVAIQWQQKNVELKQKDEELKQRDIELRQKDNELLFIAMEYLGGGSQKRNLGISAIELYWNTDQHRDLCISLLIGSAIYLLRESHQGDSEHELYNLSRIMTFLLDHTRLDTKLNAHYHQLLLSIEAAYHPKNDKNLKVKHDDLTLWKEKLQKYLEKNKI